MGKATLRTATAIALSMMLAACGGGDDNGGGGGTGTDKPNSAEVQALIKREGVGGVGPCEISLKKGPPIQGVVEHVLMECPDPLGSTITVGSYYRYADEAALQKHKQGNWDGSPHFQNGNVAVVVANVAEGPKRLPTLINKSCGCGEIGGGAPGSG